MKIMVWMAQLKVDAGKFMPWANPFNATTVHPAQRRNKLPEPMSTSCWICMDTRRQRTLEPYDALGLHSATVYMMRVASSNAPTVLQVPDCSELHEPMRHAAMAIAS